MAQFGNTVKITSTLIARSTGSNAVTIRNIFIALKKHGLIESTTGKNGGACLAKKAKKISLWDVYNAVETDDIDEIFNFHEGSGSCPVGKNIYQLMYPHMNDAFEAMKNELRAVSLDALITELTEIIGQTTDTK